MVIVRMIGYIILIAYGAFVSYVIFAVTTIPLLAVAAIFRMSEWGKVAIVILTSLFSLFFGIQVCILTRKEMREEMKKLETAK